MSHQHTKNKKGKFGRPVWRNSTKTIKVSPMRFYSPASIQEIREAIEEAISDRLPIRAVGSGHSFSEAPVTDGILLSTDDLNKVIAHPYNGNHNLIEVEAGIKIRQLNEALDKKKLCISTMGGIDHQSLAGALSTGTHGSSMGFGTMAEMIRSIVLVSQDLQDPDKVSVYRIEKKSNQVTNHDKSVDRLILDDDVFNCAAVCFGTMGIIYSYVLEVEDMYYLRERKEVIDWAILKPKLTNGSLFEAHRSVFIQVNPYRSKKISKRSALLVTHDLTTDMSGKNLMFQRFKRRFFHKLKRTTRSFSHEIATIFPFIVHPMILYLNLRPKAVPGFLKSAVKAQKDEEYIERGYKVMYQGLDYVKERAYDCEIGIPMDKDGKYLDLVQELMDYLEYLSRKYRLHITSPMGLRFTKSSEVFMAPEHGADICYVDTPVLLAIYGRETILARIQEFLLKHNSRPHWGKLNFKLDEDYVLNQYPKAKQFIDEVAKFNQYAIFSNKFSRRILGI